MNAVMRVLAVVCLFGIYADSEARSQDKFYAVVFGVQDGRNRFNEAHTFATFAQVRPKAADIEVVDQATISWLPRAGIVRLRYGPEPGTNHPLKKSLEDVGPGHVIAQWGPFETKEELFHRAKRQAQFLNRGGVGYKAVDFFRRPWGVAINCEHAVLDVVRNPGQRIIRTGTAHGHYGSSLVAEHLKGWMIEPHVTHDWLNASLGLDRYAIAKRDWGSGVQTVRRSDIPEHFATAAAQGAAAQGAAAQGIARGPNEK